MSAALEILDDLQQGSQDWFDLRKNKITATDAPIIMGATHWKTKIQLYYEKKSDSPPFPPNERMQRGIDLEPIARDLFILKTGIIVEPKVFVKNWQMASLDGVSADGKVIVEIKCPGEKDHSVAMNGKVPDHYYPQIQHQIYVTDAETAYYFSFDGIDGVIVKVERDDEYIAKMIEEEKKFFDCLDSNTPPEKTESDYIERSDDLWDQCAAQWKSVVQNIKELEKKEQELRDQLIFLSGDSNSRGSGVSLCQVTRKGNIDYSKVPHLKGVDLEPYRKESITSWRISNI